MSFFNSNMKYQISKLPPLLKKYKCNIFFSKKVSYYTRQLVSQICVSAGFVWLNYQDS